MGRPLEILENHECETIEKFNASAKGARYEIQKLSDDHWYWARWSRKGNTADGILFCPYCGEQLRCL